MSYRSSPLQRRCPPPRCCPPRRCRPPRRCCPRVTQRCPQFRSPDRRRRVHRTPTLPTRRRHQQRCRLSRHRHRKRAHSPTRSNKRPEAQNVTASFRMAAFSAIPRDGEQLRLCFGIVPKIRFRIMAATVPRSKAACQTPGGRAPLPTPTCDQDSMSAFAYERPRAAQRPLSAANGELDRSSHQQVRSEALMVTELVANGEAFGVQVSQQESKVLHPSALLFLLSARAQRRTPRALARAKQLSRMPFSRARATPHASRPSARQTTQPHALLRCARSAARLAPQREPNSSAACPEIRRAH